MMRWLAMVMMVSAGVATAAPPPANPFSARLARLTDIQRRAAMRRAVLDSAQYCRTVETAARRGAYRNLDLWQVRCDRGADYGVFVGPDGSVQVRPCGDMAQLKLPRCTLPPRKPA